MNKRLTYIDPLQCGKVLAALYGLISLIFVPFILLFSLVGAHSAQSGGPMVGGLFMVILIPFLYALLGFIGGIIAAAIYNFVAKLTGGILFTVTEDAPRLL